MELWTEYEGRTIEGAFPLNKLLLPEGRSAFFSTSNGKGIPTVIRLIASHFDEEEILARWRGVESFGHPNILKIEQFGQLVLDDTTVVYAVFEPVDASLAEVIGGQRLSITEARQLASSMASALEALHTHGFVHEHVDPVNVFAVGEVVKLRGDCIRETPEGERGIDAKRQDIHDLAMVLLRALTQSDSLEQATRVRPLPAPFDEIVRNGLSGTWELTQIATALDSTGPKASTSTVSHTPAKVVERVQVATPKPVPSDTIVSDSPQARGRFVPPAAKPIFAVEDWRRSSLPPAKWLAAGGLGLLILFWLIWHVTHGSPANQSAARVTSQATSELPPAESTKAKPAAAVTAAAANKPATPVQQNAGAGAREWRVVAFTYNHADQAQQKVKTIAQAHGALHPEVFTPTGHAPYLVTVGGVMTRDQAFALAQRARNEGLPHDTYAQNYRGNGR